MQSKLVQACHIAGLPTPLSGLAVLFAAFALVATHSAAQQLAQPASPATARSSSVIATRQAPEYGRLPMSFEANHGQTDSRVRFASHGNGYSLFLTGTEAALALGPNAKSISDFLRMQFTGSSPRATIAGEQPLPGTANYFLGNDPAQWHSAVPTFRRVRYAGLYPGVDLVYYGNQRQLEYDFVVAPSADPRRIRLHFAGAKKLRIDADGTMVITAKNGEIAFQKPAIYQEQNGRRETIEGRFALTANHTAGFRLGNYDRSRPLIIDPVLSYSTYLGGTGGDWGSGIAVDAAGSAYITGWTSSTDFPVSSGAFQTAAAKQAGIEFRYTAFVTKLNSSGTAIEYSTYLGGSGGDNLGMGIAVDRYGEAYVVGFTNSYYFPTTSGAFQTVRKPYADGNAFVTKLNATGTALVYSTFIGGSNEWDVDRGNAIAVDSSGDAYITGSTGSTDFPVSNGAFQTTNNSKATNAFVTELNPTGTAIVYSTYLGGTGYVFAGYTGPTGPPTPTDPNAPSVPVYGDIGYGIAVDDSGSAYVVGSTPSSDFPVTAGAFQSTNNNPNSSPFVTKVNPTGTGLVYSTFVGGSGTGPGGGIPEQANAVAVDGSGNAYVAGVARSIDFPVTAGAFQTSASGSNHFEGSDGFIFKLNPAATALIYSSYLGGTVDTNFQGTAANGVAVDSAGNAYIGGITGSTAFPVTAGAIETTNEGRASPLGYTGFVSEIDSTGSALLYSTFLGGTPPNSGGTGDSVSGLAYDGNGGVYVTGYAYSQDFPVTAGAYQTKNNGASVTAFVTKLNLNSAELSINFARLTTPVVYGVRPVHLEATSTSGRKVDFRVQSGPGFVHHSKLTITGAGTVVVAAYLEGGPEVTQSIMVIKATPRIRLESWTHSGDHDHSHDHEVTLKAALWGVGDTPTGKVTFFDGDTRLGESWANWNGEAVFETHSLSAGTKSITAVYGGNGNYVGVTSTPLDITVQ